MVRAAMATDDPIRGELQEQVMRVTWRLGSGTVEDVRKSLAPRRRSAYTTVQTVLNRLAERGLLRRERVGKAIYYSPRISEADYLSRSLTRTLAGASGDARRTAIAGLVGDLQPDEFEKVRRLARGINRRR